MPSGALSQPAARSNHGNALAGRRPPSTCPPSTSVGVLPWRGFSVMEAGIIDQGILVPTLIRFLVIVLVLGGLAFGAMYALATLVEPQPRDMTTTIPNNRLPAR